MRLTAFTDYTLRTLVYLAGQHARLVTIGEIAALHGMSHHHLNKVVHQLGLTGVIRTVRGRHGGITLALPPEAPLLRITLPVREVLICAAAVKLACTAAMVLSE